MTVREAALEAIRLAEQRNAEEEGINDQVGFEVGYEWGSDAALRARIASRPAERALIDYLASLPADVLFKLRTLMYFGRGDSDDILWLHAHLGNDPTDMDAAVSSMVGKSPLPRYLQGGLMKPSAHQSILTVSGPRPQNSRHQQRSTMSRGQHPPSVFSRRAAIRSATEAQSSKRLPRSGPEMQSKVQRMSPHFSIRFKTERPV